MICTHCKDSGNFSVSFIPQYDIPFANCEIKLTHKTCGAVVDIKDMIKMETNEVVGTLNANETFAVQCPHCGHREYGDEYPLPSNFVYGKPEKQRFSVNCHGCNKSINIVI